MAQTSDLWSDPRDPRSVNSRGEIPSYPAHAIEKMLSKLDEEDKNTFNWLVRLARESWPCMHPKIEAP